MIWIPKRRDLIVPKRFRRAEPERRGVCGLSGIVNPYTLGSASFQVGAINLNGSTQGYTKGSAFTGQAASTKGIFSAWLLPDALNGAKIIQGRDAGGTTYVDVQSSNNGSNMTLVFTMNDSVGTTRLAISTTTGFSTGAWHHIAASWDVSVVGARSIFVDGVADMTVTTFSNTSIAYNLATLWGLGNNALSASRFQGGMAEVYFASGQFIDLTVAANLAKFRDAANHPVDLGATGSTPTGSAPLFFDHIAAGTGVAADFATNRAGNGNWTSAGSPTLRGTSP